MTVSRRVVSAIGLGSNLDDPAVHLERALKELTSLAASDVLKTSPLYRSRALLAPDAPEPQPDYCNAAVLLWTGLPPLALLDALRAIEVAHGRVRHRRWAPRTLDLDILVYGDLRLHKPTLTIPHPRIAERNFVLFPLRDIAPEMDIPGLGMVRDLAANLSAKGLKPWH